VSGAEAVLAKVLLATASVCLVLIAVGLAGAVVWVNGLEPGGGERDDGWGR